jgi:hypothetical protein
MPPLARFIGLAFLSLPLLLVGCATTTVETSGAALPHPLCAPSESKLPVALYWEPQWRSDQKDPPVREALAKRGIEQFVAEHACLSVTELRRLPAEAGIPGDGELLQMASKTVAKPERVVFVVLRELGPRLLIGVPVLIEGGTEVVIEVRVLDAASLQVLANFRTRWRNGGKFVIKGIKSLDKDMSAALRAALMSEATAR